MKVFLATMARKVDYKLVKQYQNEEEIQWRSMPSAIAQRADGVDVKLTCTTSTLVYRTVPVLWKMYRYVDGYISVYI